MVFPAWALAILARRCDPAVTAPPPQILAVIDDDPAVARLLRGMLDPQSAVVCSANTGAAGLDLVRSRRPGAVLLDAILPDLRGVDVLRHIADVDPLVPVLFVQARTSGAMTIEAAKSGAFDFLTKPLDRDIVRAAVARAFQYRDNASPEEDRAEAPWSDSGDEALVGQSAAMLEAFKSIGRFAGHDDPVLIQGEPGTGKEAFARALHEHRAAPGGEFLTLHCPAYAEERLHEELFGRDGEGGLWRQGQGGTLVIQEVGSLPLSIQTAVVDRLQAKSRIDASDVPPRIVATASVSLDPLVPQGAFRSDLYYQLAACMVRLPALRERVVDLEALARSFLAESATSEGADFVLAGDAVELLRGEPWPGNLDELRSVLRRAVAEAPGRVLDAEVVRAALCVRPRTAAALSRDSDESFVTNWRRFVDERLSLGTAELHSECLAEAERKLLARLLEHTSGNQAQAARVLGISRASLRKKIRALGVPLPG